MPISGVLVTCKVDAVNDVRLAIAARPQLEVRDEAGRMLVVITDTATLEEDKAELNWLSALPGVVSALITYTNSEDLAEATPVVGENL